MPLDLTSGARSKNAVQGLFKRQRHCINQLRFTKETIILWQCR